jgi:hypothetical protein
VLNKELILLRPRRADGVPIAKTGEYDETAANADALRDMVPVDSFDFTGITLNPGGEAHVWHYARQTDGWKFVYPGRYDGAAASRHQGTVTSTGWTQDAATDNDPWKASAPGTLGETAGVATNANPASSYPDATFTIQLAAPNTPGPNRWQAAMGSATPAPSPAEFPFGGFARNGDALHVPFIGAYRIITTGALAGTLLEMNTVSMDSVFAEDSDQDDDLVVGDTAPETREDIGRFSPIRHATGVDYDDFGYDPTGAVDWSPMWRYHWAMDLFDYVTVHAPHDDYSPEVPQPHQASVPPPYLGEPTYSPTFGLATTPPDPVLNTAAPPANGPSEETTGVHGLVNINTASWKVLAAVPLVLTAGGAVDQAATDTLAKDIVFFRDINDGSGAPHGPFRSIFELNRVTNAGGAVVFANAGGTISLNAASGTEPGKNLGDTSPGDGVRGDYEEKWLAMTRISNLITTRSDSFTCYALLQGWRFAETPVAELMTQRREGFFLDRTNVIRLPGKTDLNAAAAVRFGNK